MKIKALADLCKKSKSITLVDQREGEAILRQWVSPGMGFYPLDGLPELTEETLLTVFDVPNDERKQYSVRRTEAAALNRYLEDNEPEDQEARPAPVSLVINGVSYLPMYTPYGLVTIWANSLAPVNDTKGTNEFFARELPGGIVILVKNGFRLCGTIGQVKEWTKHEGVVESMGDLSRYACRLANEQAQDGND